MNDKAFDEIFGGNGFGDEFAIFVAIVMESDVFAVIAVDSRLCNRGTTEVATDIIYEISDFSFGRRSVDIKAILSGFIAFGSDRFERRPQFFQQHFQENRLEGFAERFIAKIAAFMPNSEFVRATFGEDDVDVRVPIHAASEGVQNADESGSLPLKLAINALGNSGEKGNGGGSGL